MMTTTLIRWAQALFLSAATLLAVGCATPQATSSKTELPFDEAVAKATDGLVMQTQGFVASMSASAA